MDPHAPATKVAARRNNSSFMAEWGGGRKHFPTDGNAIDDCIHPQHKGPKEEYAIARLKVIPAARGKRALSPKSEPRNETEALHRRQGRYRKKRNHALQEIQQQDQYGRQPAWKELRDEVNAFRWQINYGPAQEEVNAHAPFGKANTQRERRDKKCAVEKKP